MTDEQAKYRKGQIVTVRVLIRHDGPDYDGDVLIGRNVPGDWSTMHVPAADIVSVEPPPLKVGDWVHIGHEQKGLAPTRIVAIDDGTAWLRDDRGNSWAWLCDAYGNRSAHPLSDLVRA